jgi:fibronectin-binding autotransporter adhesin
MTLHSLLSSLWKSALGFGLLITLLPCATFAQTGPAGPSYIYAQSSGAGQAYVQWNTVATASKYRLYRWSQASGWVLLTSSLTNSSTVSNLQPAYNDTTLAGTTQYWYCVYSVDAAGNYGSPSPYGAVTAGVAHVATPTSPKTTILNTNSVQVSWGAVSGATSYNIMRWSNSLSVWQLIASGLTGTAYTDIGLTAATNYYYVVSAADANGTGGWSSSVGVSIPAPTAAPVLLSATPHDGSVTLVWGLTGGVSSYTILSGTQSGGETTSIVVPAAAAGPGGVPQQSYNVSGLVDGTRYYFVVMGSNPPINSPASNELSAVPNPATPPAAPVNVTATIGTVAFAAPVTISWNPSVSATSYQVFLGTNPGGESTTANTTTSTSITFNNLALGTKYYFIVKAVNNVGVSPASTEVSVVPQLQPVTYYTNSGFNGGTKRIADDGQVTFLVTGQQWKRFKTEPLGQLGPLGLAPVLTYQAFCSLPDYCVTEVILRDPTGATREVYAPTVNAWANNVYVTELINLPSIGSTNYSGWTLEVWAMPNTTGYITVQNCDLYY